MSYIHDALKASSAQRKQSQVSDASGAGQPRSVAAPERAGISPGRWLLIILLGLLLLWFWNRWSTQQASEEVVTPDQAVPSAPPVEMVSEPDLSGVKIRLRANGDQPVSSVRAGSVDQAAATSDSGAVTAKPDSPSLGLDTGLESAAEPVSEDPYANLPYLRQLPVELQREVRGIRFSVHIHSATAASRLVKYEGRVLREGDFIRPGLRVEAIIPRGVVLQYRQTRFKVPAL